MKTLEIAFHVIGLVAAIMAAVAYTWEHNREAAWWAFIAALWAFNGTMTAVREALDA